MEAETLEYMMLVLIPMAIGILKKQYEILRVLNGKVTAIYVDLEEFKKAVECSNCKRRLSCQKVFFGKVLCRRFEDELDVTYIKMEGYKHAEKEKSTEGRDKDRR